MKLRQRKNKMFPRWVGVSVEGKTVKRFHTLTSAKQFVHVLRRLKYSDEEWEEHQRSLDFLKWLEEMKKEQGVKR